MDTLTATAPRSWAVRTVPRAAGVSLVAASVALQLPVGIAAASGQCQGAPVHAAADGMRVAVLAEDYLLVPDLADVGIPTAQSCVDAGIGTSQSLASNPYPGATVLSVPALASGTTGQEVPDYPLYAFAQHPTTPESKVEQPGYLLRATSTPTSSKSAAEAGVLQDDGSAGRTSASSASTVDPRTGAATATARSDAVGFTFNDTLTLGRVRSVATATVSSDGKLTRSSDLSIADTTVGGQRVAITPEGVVAGDESAALPTSEADPVTSALEQAGIRVRYLAPVETRQGVVAAGVEVSARQQDPTSGAVVTVTYTFGRASASARSSSADVPETGPGLDQPVGGGVGGTARASGGPDGLAVPSAGPANAAAADLSDVAPTTDSAGEPVAAPMVARPTGDAVPVAMVVDIGAAGIYLMIVFAGVAIFTCAMLLRLLGVRTRWT